MENKNSKRGPPKKQANPEKRPLAKTSTQAWLGAAPWAPPRRRASVDDSEVVPTEDRRNLRPKAPAGAQTQRKQGTSKKQPGKEKYVSNTQQYNSQRAGTGSHFWGQTLQEQPAPTGSNIIKHRPPKVFKQFG